MNLQKRVKEKKRLTPTLTTSKHKLLNSQPSNNWCGVQPDGKRRFKVFESQQRRLAAGGDELEEGGSLPGIEVLLQDVPKPEKSKL